MPVLTTTRDEVERRIREAVHEFAGRTLCQDLTKEVTEKMTRVMGGMEKDGLIKTQEKPELMVVADAGSMIIQEIKFGKKHWFRRVVKGEVSWVRMR